MVLQSKIYVAGHRGLVGSAIVRVLHRAGYCNLVLRNREELDLTDRKAVLEFFTLERPQYVFLAAARVGGIVANNKYPAHFIFQNVLIETSVLEAAFETGVDRLLFLGSSCIYPKHAPQPMAESALLTGSLEPTNRPYAVAKIAGIEMCWASNRQYGTRFLAAMPTNLYGPGDNYDLETSHVIPALIRKMHQAKMNGRGEVALLGTGKPHREFLYSDDAAEACLFLMNLNEATFDSLVTSQVDAPLVNIGFGKDMTIREVAQLVAEVVGFEGALIFDSTKPDGTPRKLLDVSLLSTLGWSAKTSLRQGIHLTYQDYLRAFNLSTNPTESGSHAAKESKRSSKAARA